ncbi:MAG: hypothetical protein GXX79_11185 [Actinomycetales bacterium]|nr:hypothetical protein [Actinomycetales bacterium]
MDNDAIRATRRRRTQMIVLAVVFLIVFVGRLVSEPPEDTMEWAIILGIVIVPVGFLLLGYVLTRRSFRKAAEAGANLPGVRHAFAVVTVPQVPGPCVLTASDLGLCLWRYQRGRLEEEAKFAWAETVISKDTIPDGIHVWNVIELRDGEGFVWLTPARTRPASATQRDALLKKIVVLQGQYSG